MLMDKLYMKIYILVDGHVLANFTITSNNLKIETKHLPFIFPLLTQKYSNLYIFNFFLYLPYSLFSDKIVTSISAS